MSREAITRAVAAGAEADRADRLLQELSGLTAGERDAGLGMAAAVLSVSDAGGNVLRTLAASPEPTARRVALELIARLPVAPERALLPALRPLLSDRRLPAPAQFAAVVVLLQTAGKAGSAGSEVLRSFLTGRDKSQIRELLQALQQRLGKLPAIADMWQRLDAKLGQHCPQCGQRVEKSELALHLWNTHRLVLDGQLARPPWAVVDEWLSDAALTGNPDDLGRCFEMALHAADAVGLARLERALVVQGIVSDLPARPEVTSTCPRCATPFALPEHAFRPLNVAHGRLTGDGCCVIVDESGWLPRLDVMTPTEVVCRGREPGLAWTRRGATVFLVGPAVLLALILALTLAGPALAVAAALGAALMLYAFVQLRWRLEDPATDRAVDHAWATLVPHLLAAGLTPRDRRFLAALAQASAERGRPQYRERALENAQQALQDEPLLVRLAAADAAALQRDPVAVVTRALGRCLEGQAPLAFAERFLAGWDAPWLTAGQRARLRVLFCQRAFEADWTVADLVEAGRLAPALGILLRTDQPAALADLHHLATLRLTRPWEFCGEAYTVFELAEQPGGGLSQLAACPDLLLHQFLTGHDRKATGVEALLICSRGVVVGKKAYSALPLAVDLPPAIAERATLWLTYLKEFRTNATAAGRGALHVRASGAQKCAQCGESFVPRAGGAGIPVAAR